MTPDATIYVASWPIPEYGIEVGDTVHVCDGRTMLVRNLSASGFSPDDRRLAPLRRPQAPERPRLAIVR